MIKNKILKNIFKNIKNMLKTFYIFKQTFLFYFKHCSKSCFSKLFRKTVTKQA